jgi:putative phosphoribosyl transferase
MTIKSTRRSAGAEQAVRIETATVTLEGNLNVPTNAEGIVLFAHGSGSGRHSPRNRFVAKALNEAHLATLLLDLLTVEEEAVDATTGHLRFNIGFLAHRLMEVTDWVLERAQTRGLAVGYFGASTGAGAALFAASQKASVIGAVVSRGGRPDLAGPALRNVQAPTLLIVGGNDVPVIGLNEDALDQLGAAQKQLVIVPGATHLFEEAGALEEVARLAADWFNQHLRSSV